MLLHVFVPVLYSVHLCDVQFQVVASVSSTNYTSNKVVTIDNAGPVATLSTGPALGGSYVIDSLGTTTATVSYVSGAAIASVSFYLDQTSMSTFIGTVASSPFTTSFSAPGLSLSLTVNQAVAIRAVVKSSGGASTVLLATGLVKSPNVAPSGITLSPSVLSIPETSTAGTVVATLSSVDANPGDTFTYTIPTAGVKFAIVGSSLVVASGVVFDFTIVSSYTFNIMTTDQGGLSYTRSVTVSLSRVNQAPSSMTLSRLSLPEDSAVNSVVGTFSVTCRDSTTFTMQLLNTGAGSFYVSGMALYVAKTLSFNSAPTVTITAQATDSNGLSLALNFNIIVTWVNKAPTAISLSNDDVQVSLLILSCRIGCAA